MPKKTYTVRLRGQNYTFMSRASEKGLSGAETLRAAVQLAREANLLDELDPPTSPSARPNQVDTDDAAESDVARSEVDGGAEHGGGVTAADVARAEGKQRAGANDDSHEPEDATHDDDRAESEDGWGGLADI
jgi:hypothetical protein